MGSKIYRGQYFFINKSRGVGGGEAWRAFTPLKKNLDYGTLLGHW